MDKQTIYNSLVVKYPELANYIKLIVARKQNKLYRESFLYMRLAEEYVVEILASQNGLSLVSRITSSSYDFYGDKSLYSLLEELYKNGILSNIEKDAYDEIRRCANAALHRGTSNEYLERVWNTCYDNIYLISSVLIVIENSGSNRLTIYTEGDFLKRMYEEFPEEMQHNEDIIEATNLFLNRIKLNIMSVEKAQSVVDYFVTTLKGGTLPMLAVTYAIKLSQQ